jgi:hypothetical protein
MRKVEIWYEDVRAMDFSVAKRRSRSELVACVARLGGADQLRAMVSLLCEYAIRMRGDSDCRVVGA